MADTRDSKTTESEFATHLKREAFAAAMSEMANDPAIQADCAAIAGEFEATESDGNEER